MKTKNLILVVSIFMLNTTIIKAQSWDQNGNNVSSLKYLGTNSGFDLPLYVNGTEKARFMTSGELGLGTTTPASWLHIAPSGTSESFRTVASNGDAWRMYRGAQELGRLWIAGTANAFNIYGVRGPLHFSTGSTTGTTTNCAEFIGGTGSVKVGLG